MCVDFVLTSPRIAQADLGRRTLPRGGFVTAVLGFPTLLDVSHLLRVG
jgi:hypothetical protein